MFESQPQPLLVLIASHGEWVGRSVESVLELNNYQVIRVENGRRALELARRTNPDVLILDSALAEMGGIEVCRALASDPLFDPSAPIFITSPAPVSNRVRAAAYEAGAWDFCSHPLDVETLLLKMETFLRARRRLAAAYATSLLDPLTGLYSQKGLQHWAVQLGARATRNHEPLACVMVMANGDPTSAAGGMAIGASLSYLADVCRAQSRKSDVVGYVGDSRFAILAPETDGDGARQFIDRLQRALESHPAVRVEARRDALQVGFYAVSDFSAAGVDSADVVRRAESALAYAAQRGFASGPCNFDELPVA